MGLLPCQKYHKYQVFYKGQESVFQTHRAPLRATQSVEFVEWLWGCFSVKAEATGDVAVRGYQTGDILKVNSALSGTASN